MPDDSFMDEVNGMYFDKEGNPISARRCWVELHPDDAYSVIRQEVVESYYVSTVWLGLNHNYGPGPPIIFETMVFASPEYAGRPLALEYECRRYSTEAAAIAGHQETVLMIRATSATLQEALHDIEVQHEE